ACAAETLFAPVIFAKSGADRESPFRFEALGSLTPCWVCPSETGKGYVIRLHETRGAAGTARLHLTQPAGGVRLVDLLEKTQSDDVSPPATKLDRTTYDIPYRPYQVVSILVR
ncbi:MAG: glycosyl hydrolase-related protein, partial [Planctomycetota bacterium]